MPARARAIGPDDSMRVAEIIREARQRRGLSMPGLAAEMAAHGHEISAATINSIENGIASHSRRRTRLVTVDELKAFTRVLGIEPQLIMDWLYND